MTIDPLLEMTGGWVEYKAALMVKSMGYDIHRRYKTKGFGTIDILGRRMTDNNYDHVIVGIEKAKCGRIKKQNLLKAIRLTSRFHDFDSKAAVILAFPTGTAELDEELLDAFEECRVLPRQVSPPEHPVAGPHFFEATMTR